MISRFTFGTNLAENQGLDEVYENAGFTRINGKSHAIITKSYLKNDKWKHETIYVDCEKLWNVAEAFGEELIECKKNH